MKEIDTKIKGLFDLYDRYGGDSYHGEPLSQLSHALQTTQFAIKRVQDRDLILASFLHDVGFLLKDMNHGTHPMYGNLNHEVIGADYLRGIGFSDRICKLVKRHVDGKRYLCYKDSNYYQLLSHASKLTLIEQGDVMQIDEAMEFERDPDFQSILDMRRWDDMSKDRNKHIDHSLYKMMRDMCREHLIYETQRGK